MRILLAVASFCELTGAELYCYELARELKARSHDVLIASSRVGGTIFLKAQEAKIKVVNLFELPKNAFFDLLHLQEPQPTKYILSKIPHIPAVMTIHSQWPCEQPIISPRIRQYIAIRSDIKKKMVEIDQIRDDKITVIHNGVDFNRFNKDFISEAHDKKRILFVGTLDRIRYLTIQELARRARAENFELWIVGKNHFMSSAQWPENARYFPPVWEIERFVKACDETAGIMLGRSTIEGWACGKPGWIYDIDLEGKPKSKAIYPPPAKMSEFSIQNMTSRVLGIYERALHQ
jgi:glycosyltransferase involved in cell wall biosynthesis